MKNLVQAFQSPHAIAVCPDGSALYVVEAGPNKVWKFDLHYVSDSSINRNTY